MTKALTVLAECVDARSGRRFSAGDDFEPAPTVEQAKRLIAAGCLPDAALKSAKETDADVMLAAKAEQKAKAARDKAAKDLDAAQAELDAAEMELQAAETFAAEASTIDEKTASAEAVDAASARSIAAKAAVSKLQSA